MADAIAQVLALIWSAWRRRAYALAVAWLVCLTGWGAVVLMRDIYQSSAIIHVNTASILEPLLRGLTVPTNIEAELELMQRTLLSRPNIEKLVRATDLDLTVKDSAEMERLTADLSKRISLRRQRANLFMISFTDHNPRRARDVVQGLLDLFVESNLGQNREDLDKARRFIEDQIRVYEQQLEQAEFRLARFKQENMAMLGRGDDGYKGQLEAATAALEQAETALRDARLRRDTLRRELEHIPQFLPANAQGTGPPSDTTIQILQMERHLEDLLSRYTEKHPDVVIARRKLEALQEQREQELAATVERDEAASTESDGSGAGGFSNPVYEQLKVQLVEEEARIATLTNQVVEARAALEKVASLAERAPEVQAELAKLNRDYGVLTNKYQALVSSREAERILRAREFGAEDIQFRIVQPPEIPSLPSGPNRTLFMLVVLVVGLGAGVGLTVVLAFAGETFTSVGELKSTFALPVLGSVSISDCARTSLWVRAKSLVFWVCLGALLAVCAGLVLIEVQIGFGQLVTQDLLSRIPAEWLRWLAVS